MMAWSRVPVDKRKGSPDSFSSSLRLGRKVRRTPCGVLMWWGSTERRKTLARARCSYCSSVSAACCDICLRGGAALLAVGPSSISCKLLLRSEAGDLVVPDEPAGPLASLCVFCPSCANGLDPERAGGAAAGVMLIFVLGATAPDDLSAVVGLGEAWSSALLPPSCGGFGAPSLASRRARICRGEIDG